MNIKWLFVLLFSILLFYVNKHFIRKNTIMGNYVNNNTAPVLEGPSSIENGVGTLILLKNNEFKSKTWGSGVYQIEYSLRGTRVTFSYQIGTSTASFTRHVSNSLLGKKRICLNHDMGFFFEKIEE